MDFKEGDLFEIEGKMWKVGHISTNKEKTRQLIRLDRKFESSIEVVIRTGVHSEDLDTAADRLNQILKEEV